MSRRLKRKKEKNPKWKIVHGILLGLSTVLSLVSLIFTIGIFLNIQQFIDSTFIDPYDVKYMSKWDSYIFTDSIKGCIYSIILSAIASLITSRLINRIAIAKWVMLLNLLAPLFAVAMLYYAYSTQEKYF